jgi:ribonuclease T2
MLRRSVFLAAAFAFAALTARADPTPADLVAPAQFDFYVLTLSWSPGFCDLRGARRAPAQCASPAGFVVHGLWPDSARGQDPRACGLAPAYIPPVALAYATRVYPSRGLAIHEWREHGTCTGLDAAHYFRAVRHAREEIAIPDAFAHAAGPFLMSPGEIAKRFQAANPGLTQASMAVTCEGGELLDVRICLTRDLSGFARCPKVTRRSCRDDSVNVAPMQ